MALARRLRLRNAPQGRLVNTTARRRQHAVADGAASGSRTPLTSILVANRGEIALRVARTAAQNGVRITTIYTDPDAHAQHATASPFALGIGGTSAYLDGDRIIALAKQHGCNAIHPGYGFLSENAGFARKCTEAGLTFIGPPWSAIDAMGDKSRSKEIMNAAGVPCIPGYHGSNQDPAFLKQEAEKIGYPVLLKAVKGGGGKGMRIVQTPAEFDAQLNSAKSEARNSFGDDTMLVERYITTPRHIEVQVFADRHGACVALGERDCSVQRRHQKVLEESPAPHLDEATRQDLWAKAREAALAVGYEGAGTVEFIFDNDSGEFFFMEMNTRLQVEHPVSEMVTGQDLVKWQFIVAEGGHLPLTQEQIQAEIAERGHAIEARIYAENPDNNFLPDSGRIVHMRIPATNEDVRVDSGFRSGDDISPHYDPMIAKLIVRGPDRETAIRKLDAALQDYEVAGPTTNIEFLKTVCRHPAFIAGDVETGFIPKHADEIFSKPPVPNETYAQAALGVLMAERAAQSGPDMRPTEVGGASSFAVRFQEGSAETGKPIAVEVSQTGATTFDVTVNGERFEDMHSVWDAADGVVRSHFPTQRLETRVVVDGDRISVFQQGRLMRLERARPAWLDKALGTKDAAHSVKAPMPCKVLRVEVEEGATVTKDQALVVIESMKMETVIRSPQDGVVAKVVHKAGDLCKAGTALIEFEETEDK